MIEKCNGVVKTEWAQGEPITAWGGLAMIEAMACRMRLWSEASKFMPARTKTGAGYDSTTVLAAMIHGLLSGARGTYAAEPLREDEALKRLLGLEAGVPEEATVWRALGQWAEQDGASKLGRLQRRLCRRSIKCTSTPTMRVEGFTPLFIDGTWLEVGRNSRFEGAKSFDGATKLMLSTLWVGPYLAAQRFVAEGEAEMTTSLDLIDPVWRDLVKPLGIGSSALILADALYGNGTALKKFEGLKGARYVVGAGGLKGMERVAAEQPESQWRDTGANAKRGWSGSALCVHTFQAADWDRPRRAVTRRWRIENEFVDRYASVLTNLDPKDARVARIMSREGISFGAAIWRLYDRKQAMENQFKDALNDLGLHHPPCAELARNEVFYAVAALSLNLAVGVRRIGFDGAERDMRLWRLRRDMFAIPARAVRHARWVTAILYSTSNRLRSSFTAAMDRLAAC